MTKTHKSLLFLLIAVLLSMGLLFACEEEPKKPGISEGEETTVVPGGEEMDLVFEDGAVYCIKTDQLMGIGGSLFGTSGGEAAEVRGYAGDLDQLFRFEKTDAGFKIVNLSTGLYLAARKGDGDGAAACLSVDKDIFPNVWTITKTDNGYTIMNNSTGGYLAPEDPEVTSVLRQKTDAAKATEWQIVKEAGSDVVFPKILSLSGDWIGESSCPAIIKADGMYYNYNQVGRIRIKASPDLVNWAKAGIVLAPEKPSWIKQEIGADGVWAPHVWHYKDEYRVYYAGSSSGSQNSVIGLSVGKSPTGPFTDMGMVIRSYKGDDYNCIDPRVYEENGDAYLVFGSYWKGIYMRKLDCETGKLDEGDPTLWHLAKGNGEMEAASIIKKDGYYYLLVAMGTLRKNATYYLAVGRSESLFGPYVDKRGRPMLEGYTSRLTEWKDGVQGAAHGEIFLDDDGTYYFVSEFWKDRSEASPTVSLLITSLVWNDDGWPVTALASDLLREMKLK